MQQLDQRRGGGDVMGQAWQGLALGEMAFETAFDDAVLKGVEGDEGGDAGLWGQPEGEGLDDGGEVGELVVDGDAQGLEDLGGGVGLLALAAFGDEDVLLNELGKGRGVGQRTLGVGMEDGAGDAPGGLDLTVGAKQGGKLLEGQGVKQG